MTNPQPEFGSPDNDISRLEIQARLEATQELIEQAVDPERLAELSTLADACIDHATATDQMLFSEGNGYMGTTITAPLNFGDGQRLASISRIISPIWTGNEAPNGDGSLEPEATFSTYTLSVDGDDPVLDTTIKYDFTLSKKPDGNMRSYEELLELALWNNPLPSYREKPKLSQSQETNPETGDTVATVNAAEALGWVIGDALNPGTPFNEARAQEAEAILRGIDSNGSTEK